MSDEVPAKSWLKRVFKRDIARTKESSNNASPNSLGPPRPRSYNFTRSASEVAIAKQPTKDPSTLILTASEKTLQRDASKISVSATRVPMQETAATVTLFRNQDTNMINTQAIPMSLWDKAYDSLKQEKPELMSKYEDLLSRVLIRGNALSTSSQQEDDEDVGNQIPQQDVAGRRDKLKLIAELGLQHMEDKKAKVTILGHEISLQDGVGQVGEALSWAQEYLKDAIKDVPYAPAVMAGITLVLPLLKNPATADAANRDGFIYVTSQMRYYVEMETLLLPEDIKPGLKGYLTEGVVDLYKLIIDFQVRSVLRFYRSGTKNYFKGVINFDKWNDRLDHLMNEERKLTEKFESALSSTSVQQLKKLAGEADGSRKALNGILDNILGVVAFLNRAEQRTSNDEHRRCLATLQGNDSSFDPTLDKARIEKDKGGLLRDSYCWVLDNVDFRKWRDGGCGQLLWIKGDPGKGKTMLLCGVIDELYKMAAHDINISFFFCQATNSRINSATAVLRGLIYMLVQQQPSLAAHIRDGSFEGENAWFALLKVFTNILDDPKLQKTYLVIDALDECVTDLDQLLSLLAQKTSASHVKWIVSSRNWPNIEKGLRGTSQVVLRLESNHDTLAAAIDSFILYKVNELAEENEYKPNTRAEVYHHLRANANDTFLWIALVCKKLAKVANRNVRKKLKDFPSGLDELYKRMLSQISQSDDAELCRTLLSVTTTVFRPITLDEIGSCIDLPEDIVGDRKALEEIVGYCGSFLTIREGTISLIHQSAKDFLIREAIHVIFPDGVERIHYTIFSKSLQSISKTLLRDIYGLAKPGFPVDQVNKPHPDPLATVHYSCVHWIDHLGECFTTKNAKDDLQESGIVGLFFRQDFLHWLEALSLSRSLSDGIASMLKLEYCLKTSTNDSHFMKRFQDACRFALHFKPGIENYPLQVYHSGLIFSPTSSMTRIQFEKERPMWLIGRPTMEHNWNACLQTLEGHNGGVNSVTFSHDSKLLASASRDNTVKTWDASSGQCLHTLEGHSDGVRSVVFSHDSKLLASASSDNTVKVWDSNSGQCLRTLKGHSQYVTSITFSYDSKLLASASWDNTVKVWDSSSYQCLHTIKAHDHFVSSVTFSHDSNLLASASWDSTVKIWDSSSGHCLHILQGHSREVNSVTFSHDSKLLASASRDNMVKTWDATSGKCLHTLEGHSGEVESVIFSHDSKLLASASSDKTVKVWDSNSGQCLRTLKGHSQYVTSITFSYDSKLLASASWDNTVKLWDSSSNQYLQTFDGHSEGVNLITFSPDSELVTSTSWDNTVKVWDSSSSKCLRTLEGHSDFVTSVAFSRDSKLLASGSCDNTVRVWNSSSGQCLHTLGGHSGDVHSVTFSDDSKLLVSTSWDHMVKVWDSCSGKCLQTLEGHSSAVNTAIFSHDSKLVVSGSGDNTVRVWDSSSGQCLHILEGHSDFVTSVAFSHDSKLLASASQDEAVKVWDASSGQCLHTLEGHGNGLKSATFSHDSKLLASVSWDNTVKVWNASSGKCLQAFLFDGSVAIKSFGDLASRLELDIGTICCCSESSKESTTTDPQLPLFEGLGVSPERVWITWNSENLLWLPPDYRSSASAVSHLKLSLGCASGRVSIFNFDSDKLSYLFARHSILAVSGGQNAIATVGCTEFLGEAASTQ